MIHKFISEELRELYKQVDYSRHPGTQYTNRVTLGAGH